MRGRGDERARRLSQGVFIVFYTVLVLHASERWLWEVDRVSPTLALDGAVRISELHPDVGSKDTSLRSFPGDHGIALILFAGHIWFFCGRRLGLVATGAVLVLIWPRIVVGAHWLTDIAVGSLALGGACLGIALATPVHAIAVSGLSRPARMLLRRFAPSPRPVEER